MKIKQILAAVIAFNMVMQSVPIMPAFADENTEYHSITVNNQVIDDKIIVTYGEVLSVSVDDVTVGTNFSLAYAESKEEADNDDFTTITNNEICKIKPGKDYVLKCSYSDDVNTWTQMYAFEVKKATLATPENITYNNGEINWTAVSSTDNGNNLIDSPEISYKISVKKNGTEIENIPVSVNKTNYSGLADKIATDSKYDKGEYSFKVTAVVNGDKTEYYENSLPSAEKSASTAVQISLKNGKGVVSCAPENSFLLISGVDKYNSEQINATVKSGFEFAEWSAEGLTFVKSDSAQTTVSVPENYNGADTVEITANARDSVAPKINSYEAENGQLKAVAEDSEGITEYAFSTAESPENVIEWINVQSDQTKFTKEVTSGGNYYFYAKDADGNVAKSVNSVSVTKIIYYDYCVNNTLSQHTEIFFGDSHALAVNQQRKAYNFGGWYDNSAFTGESITSVNASPSDDIKLYAKWIPEDIDIPVISNVNKTYDGTNSLLSVEGISVTGNLSYQWYKDNTEIPDANQSTYSVKNVADSGEYYVKIQLKDNFGNVVSEINSQKITVKIDKKQLKVVADNKSITYGDSAPAYTVHYEGLAVNDTESVVTKGTVNCDYSQNGQAKEYDIIPTGYSADNYKIEYVNGKLLVGKKAITVSAEFKNPDKKYVFKLDENGNPIQHNPEIIVKNGETTLEENTDYTVTYENNIHPGKATVRVVCKGNYSGEISLDFDIEKAESSIEISTNDKTYGDSDEVVNVTKNVSSGNVTFYYAKEDSEDFTTVQPVDAGKYKVYAVADETDDYKKSQSETKTFEIKKRKITLTANSNDFDFDGTVHHDYGYTIDGDFVNGQGFAKVIVTGEVTDVTSEDNFVENKITYQLTSQTKAENYDIKTVNGKLTVHPMKLTVPSGLEWSRNPGKVTWVAVNKTGLVANYKLTLYAYDGKDYTQVAEQTTDKTSCDFSEKIRVHAKEAINDNKTYSYTYTIQTLASGGESVHGYIDSDVSGYQSEMYTTKMEIDYNENMVDYVKLDNQPYSAYVILLNGETVSLKADTKTGFMFGDTAVKAGDGLVISGTNISVPENHLSSSLSATVTAKITKSSSEGKITIYTKDESPWIDSFTAENSSDLKTVNFAFKAEDSREISAWAVTTSSTAPAYDSDEWKAISEENKTSYTGTFSAEKSGKYYLYVKDSGGNITKSDSGISVYQIDFNGGNGGTGLMDSILKVQGTSVTLPELKFTNDGYSFQNWHGNTGIYSDKGLYSANANDTLVAYWSNEDFDYTVEYYYMNLNGEYNSVADSKKKFNAVYGETVSYNTEKIQLNKKGFQLDETKNESITVDGADKTLKVYYKRLKYAIEYKYTMPGEISETVITENYYYGADLSSAFSDDKKPVKEGYTFVGWLFGSAGSQPETMPANNITVTGKFQAKTAKYYIRYYTQDIDTSTNKCKDTYTLVDSLNEDITSKQDREISFSVADAEDISGFTCEGGYISYGSANGETKPENVIQEITEKANSDAGKEVYINLYYKRNSYTVTLNVWQGAVDKEGNLKNTYNWELPYGADLSREDYANYDKDNWSHDDNYILADYTGWSTDSKPSTMPAGDVTVTRQFVSKTNGTYKVEVYIEGEEENTYSKQEFTYYDNIGKNVTVGGDNNYTINYNNFRNSINYFDYYQYKEVTDADITNGNVKGADGATLTTGVVTDTNNGKSQTVLRVFFERKTVDTTINYYFNNDDNTGNQLFHTVTKSMKWGQNHKYDYEVLAYFDSTEKFNEETKTSKSMNLTIDETTAENYDFRNNGYIVSYSGKYNLNYSAYYPNEKLDSVDDLSKNYSNPMGYSENNVNIYYTKSVPKELYYIDVCYNSKGLSHGTNQEISLTQDYNGTTYKVRVASEAMFYKDSRYVPGETNSDYPGLGYSNSNPNGTNQEGTTGRWIYSTDESNIKEGYTKVEINGKTYFTDNYGYIYIPLEDNRFFNGNYTGYSYNISEIGYESVTNFLDEYKKTYSDDPYAQGASVYNRGFGNTFMYGNEKLVITFVNGAVYNIYYNMNGTVCNNHTVAKGTELNTDKIGCNHNTFPALNGFKIGWYWDSAFTQKPESPITINSNVNFYGRYEKNTYACYENTYYELADHISKGDKEYSYITEDDIAIFTGDEHFSESEQSEEIDFVDGSGSTVKENVTTTTYSYNGEVVLIRKKKPVLAFSEVSMDYSQLNKTGFYFDTSNSKNVTKGYCQYEDISLKSYFARDCFSVIFDNNDSQTDPVVTEHHFGETITVENPVRAGYTFKGWEWYKFDSSTNDYTLWTGEDAPSGNSFTMPDYSVKAVAQWEVADFSQTVMHYFQNTSLSFDIEKVELMKNATAENKETATIVWDNEEISGKVYKSGEEVTGVSFTKDNREWYFANFTNNEDKYIVNAEDLSAVCEVKGIRQEEVQTVSNNKLIVDGYNFAYMVYHYDDEIKKLNENDKYENQYGMQADYYYTLNNNLEINAIAVCTDGGECDATITGDGSHFYGENAVLSAHTSAGFKMLGWYKASDVLENSGESTEFKLKSGWENSVKLTEEDTLNLTIRNSENYVAVIQPEEVDNATITISGKQAYTYGEKVSEENTVNAKVKFSENSSSANYVDSYQWYKDGVEIQGATSSTYHIPSDWNAGNYTLKCEAVIKRKDNGRSITISDVYSIVINKADMKVESKDYSGNYDGNQHTFSLAVKNSGETDNYEIYYSETPLNSENYQSADTTKPTYKDVHTTDTENGVKRDAYTVYYYIKDKTNNYNDYAGSAKVEIKAVTLTVTPGEAVFSKTYDGTENVQGSITSENTDLYRLVHTENIYHINGLVSGDSGKIDEYIISCDAHFNNKHVQGANAVTLENIALASKADGQIVYNYIFANSYTQTISGYIEPLDLGIKWNSTEFTYNGEVQCPEPEITGNVPENDKNNLKLKVSGGQKFVGDYQASTNVTSVNAETQLSDFKTSGSIVDYKIKARPVTVTPEETKVTYDGLSHSVQKFTADENELVSGHRISAETDSFVNAGTHSVTAKNVKIYDADNADVTENYAVTCGNGNLIINQRKLTVSGITAQDKAFDGNTDCTLDTTNAVLYNVAESDKETIGFNSNAITGAFENADKGENKTVNISYGENIITGDTYSNYSLDKENSQHTTTATIGGKAVSVTPVNTTVTYGEEVSFDSTFNGYVNDSDKNSTSGKITYKVGKTPEDAQPYSTNLPVGDYNIYADVSGLSNDNYVFTSENVGKLTVEKRNVSVASAENAEIVKTYDGTTSAEVLADKYKFGKVENETASGIVNGDSINLTFNAGFNSKDVKNSNSVKMTNLSVENNNYNLVTTEFDIKGKINQAQLTIKAEDKSVTYGVTKKPDYTVKYTGFVNNESENQSDLTGTLALQCDFDPENSEKRKAKNYEIIPSGLNSDNYKINFEKGRLTVNKKQLTITAENKSAVYGQDNIPQFTFTYSELAYDDTFNGVVTGNVTYSHNVQTENDVITSVPGDYDVTPVVSGLSADNYSFKAKKGILTISKKDLSISGITVNSKVYDGTAKVKDSQFNYSAINYEGLSESDREHISTNREITVTGTYASKDVGTGITTNIITNPSEYLTSRYKIGTLQTTVTADITARPLTITAENKTIKYGENVPTFTVKYNGFANGETAGKENVTLSCPYNVNNDAGTYTITPSAFKDSNTAKATNYNCTYNNGTLTVNANQLTAPEPQWDSSTPGKVSWSAVSRIGKVSVDSYSVTLYKDGQEISDSTQTVSATATLSVDYSEKIRQSGAGRYTVKVRAIASTENNADKKNVIDSKEGTTSGLCAANIVLKFADDNISQGGKTAETKVNNSDSYIMIAGEKNVTVSAKIKNETGYTVKSVTADCSKLSVEKGNDTARNGADYTDSISLDKTLSENDYQETITITIALSANPATLTTNVTVSPEEVTYGYSDCPVFTATASPNNDTYNDYTYSFKWQLKEGDNITKEKTLSADNGTTNTSSWTFPSGKKAKADKSYYKIRCIVTATRKDNGQSITVGNVSWNPSNCNYVVTMPVNKAPFNSDVKLEGWKYGESRKTPSVTYNPENAEVTYEYTSADNYSDTSSVWTEKIPTDAGNWYIRAKISASDNYEAVTTSKQKFTIEKNKLANPENLHRGETGTASYGHAQWNKVETIKENNGVKSESEVDIVYRVKLYKVNGGNKLFEKQYDDTENNDIDITDDIQQGGVYRFSVQAVSKNDEGTKNCENSEEVFSDEITVGGTLSVTGNGTQEGSNYSKKYDGVKTTLTAEYNGSESGLTYQWYKNGQPLDSKTAQSIDITHVSESGYYTCVITAGTNTYHTPYLNVTVSKRNVTLTSATDEKTYDKNPLTNASVTVSGDDFATGEGATYSVTGSQTYKGTSKNTFTYTLNGNTLADDYNITKVEGNLTIKAISSVITITANSNEKVYDGTALTDNGYTYTENVLLEGDKFTAVVEGSITDAGEADNVVTSYKVMCGDKDVTSNYTFAESVKGKLEVTPRVLPKTHICKTHVNTSFYPPATNSEIKEKSYPVYFGHKKT